MNAVTDPATDESPSSNSNQTPGSAPQDGKPSQDRGPSVFSLKLADLTAADPLRWLVLGWADFKRAPKIGLFYGACFFAMGHALMAVFRAAPAYVLALSAGFLLMGPFLCQIGRAHV